VHMTTGFCPVIYDKQASLHNPILMAVYHADRY
jgi:hypothetical protein